MKRWIIVGFVLIVSTVLFGTCSRELGIAAENSPEAVPEATVVSPLLLKEPINLSLPKDPNGNTCFGAPYLGPDAPTLAGCTWMEFDENQADFTLLRPSDQYDPDKPVAFWGSNVVVEITYADGEVCEGSSWLAVPGPKKISIVSGSGDMSLAQGAVSGGNPDCTHVPTVSPEVSVNVTNVTEETQVELFADGSSQGTETLQSSGTVSFKVNAYENWAYITTVLTAGNAVVEQNHAWLWIETPLEPFGMNVLTPLPSQSFDLIFDENCAKAPAQNGPDRTGCISWDLQEGNVLWLVWDDSHLPAGPEALWPSMPLKVTLPNGQVCTEGNGAFNVSRGLYRVEALADGSIGQGGYDPSSPPACQYNAPTEPQNNLRIHLVGLYQETTVTVEVDGDEQFSQTLQPTTAKDLVVPLEVFSTWSQITVKADQNGQVLANTGWFLSFSPEMHEVFLPFLSK